MEPEPSADVTVDWCEMCGGVGTFGTYAHPGSTEYVQRRCHWCDGTGSSPGGAHKLMGQTNGE